MFTPDLIKQLKKDEKAIFKGWDFSYIKNRFIQEEPTWDYFNIAKKLIKNSKSVLDMATGGGEFFSKFAPFNIKAVAIEGYHPNVSIAKNLLEPLGVKVLEANEVKKLPFQDNEFDLILNRHGGINKKSVKEIYRIQSKHGFFLTQQVDGNNFKDLINEFGKNPKWEQNTPENVKNQMIKQGFKIHESDEWTGKIIFKDVGALVYLLKAVPWLVDDFSVNNYLSKLEELHKKIKIQKELSYIAKRFYILAQK